MNTRAAGEEAQAELLRALAHPVRLRLLEELSRGEGCVCHLAALTGKPQPYISKQLAVLKGVGLVVDRRAARWVFYRVAYPRLANLLQALSATSGAPALAGKIQQPLLGCPCPKCESAI